jgi:hypothetical protein
MAQRQGFASAGWKIGGGQIHSFGDAFVDQVDDELAVACMLWVVSLGKPSGGCAAGRAAALIEVTSAIGRGATSPHNSW